MKKAAAANKQQQEQIRKFPSVADGRDLKTVINIKYDATIINIFRQKQEENGGRGQKAGAPA